MAGTLVWVVRDFTLRSSCVCLHLRRDCEVHGGPRICVVNVLRGVAPGCFRLRQDANRISVHDMKNPGCRVQPGFDCRLRELSVAVRVPLSSSGLATRRFQRSHPTAIRLRTGVHRIRALAAPDMPPSRRTSASSRQVCLPSGTVRRAQYVTFQMAEVAIPRDLFRGILARIRSLADTVSTGQLILGVAYTLDMLQAR